MDSADPVTGQQAAAMPIAPGDDRRGTLAPSSAPGGTSGGTFAVPVAPLVRPARLPHDRIWFRQTVAKLLRAPFTADGLEVSSLG